MTNVDRFWFCWDLRLYVAYNSAMSLQQCLMDVDGLGCASCAKPGLSRIRMHTFFEKNATHPPSPVPAHHFFSHGWFILATQRRHALQVTFILAGYSFIWCANMLKISEASFSYACEYFIEYLWRIIISIRTLKTVNVQGQLLLPVKSYHQSMLSS